MVRIFLTSPSLNLPIVSKSTSTSFKLQGRVTSYFSSDGDNWGTYYPDRISFAGFKN